ncbi:MAG TPA: hypothetical protein VIY53_11310 [Acidobacteriaceae bacterium]
MIAKSLLDLDDRLGTNVISSFFAAPATGSNTVLAPNLTRYPAADGFKQSGAGVTTQDWVPC